MTTRRGRLGQALLRWPGAVLMDTAYSHIDRDRACSVERRTSRPTTRGRPFASYLAVWTLLH
jgi:hypothetical protein